MPYIKDMLVKRAKELRKVQNATSAAANESPDILRISRHRGKACYYTRPADSSRSEEIYRGYEATDEIKKLAQTDYEKKLHKAASHQLRQLMQVIPYFNDNELVDGYAKMPDARKNLIDPMIPDDDLFVKNWVDFQYEGKAFDENIPELFSDKGERVRSKSEKIIADHYLKLGIPYRYECPLKLKDGGRTRIIHPDFAVLNVRSRKAYYHEHFGKMDDPDYIRTSLRRLELYIKNDLFPGESLLITHETSQRPLDMKLLDIMIDKYLK